MGTILASFYHHYGRLSWYDALNVNVMDALSRSFLFPCLNVTTTFLGLQPYGLGGLSPTSQEVSAPQAPRAGYPPQFP